MRGIVRCLRQYHRREVERENGQVLFGWLWGLEELLVWYDCVKESIVRFLVDVRESEWSLRDILKIWDRGRTADLCGWKRCFDRFLMCCGHRLRCSLCKRTMKSILEGATNQRLAEVLRGMDRFQHGLAKLSYRGLLDVSDNDKASLC